METSFIQPLDVLYLRGNRLFEGAGAYSAPLMPPWPSLAAGALRSRMLADHGVDLVAYGRGEAVLEEPLKSVLGTPREPGSFRLRHFGLARQSRDGGVEPLFPLPVDLIVTEQEGELMLYRLDTMPLPGGIRGSNSLPQSALLRVAGQSKPLGDFWLTQGGMRRWVRGELPLQDDLIASSELWGSDPRLGIALDPKRHTTEEGQLYTVDSVAMRDGTGFVTTVEGEAGLLPSAGLLRFGGDGRGATISGCEIKWPHPDWQRIEAESACKLILTSPGIFPQGWRLPGQDENNHWRIEGVEARIESAVVSRSGVISGWDLARWQPKTAERIVASGTVYTIRLTAGGVESLQRLVEVGLPLEDPLRRAEGFNRIMIANANI